jgi:hypothetical protein
MHVFKTIIILISTSLLFSECIHSQEIKPATDFGAYYTNIKVNADWETYDRTGEFADIIVNLGAQNGQFIFWRGTSYLPYWVNAAGEKFFVEEIIKRQGNGSAAMPDRVNTYSHVRLISSTDDIAVVHWRYLPDFAGSNPHTGVSATNFVDEYYTISADGKVMRTAKKGTEKIDAWNEGESMTAQQLSLSQTGIKSESIASPKNSIKSGKIEGTSTVSDPVVPPVAWFKFDEAEGDNTKESIGNGQSEITGDKTVWKRGVSGTALQFDGYKTTVKIPSDKGPRPSSAITLEGWVAIGAYPWSWCPIIQQADDVPEEVRLYRGEYDITDTEKREGDLSVGLVGGDPENQEGDVDVEQEIDFDEIEFTVKYQKEDDKGYFLGIDGNGQPGFKIRVGGKWEELTSAVSLERKKWYHIAATYDQASGEMKLYIDGEKTDQQNVSKAPIELSTHEIQIGRGKDRRPVNPVRENTFPGTYSFDGLIDEVKIYDKALSQKEISKTFNQYDSEGLADLQPRILPSGENRQTFGAYYSNLKFYDSWDNMWRFSEHSDIVVEFDNNPSKFVFWKGVSYIPMMVNDKNFWYSNEFNETWSTSGGEGCQEPMSDKQVLYNHVRILENTPARAVVHYRFPLVDVNKFKANYVEETGWYDVADWYYYIYPDGVASKVEQLWTSGERIHEWQESMAIFGPDQHPHDLIERESTFTMIRVSDGAFQTYDWNPLPPDGIDNPERANIHHVNYKGEYDPVTITDDIIWSNVYGGEITDYAIFPTWNHWPVAQMPSDGRYASFPDRTSHSSLSHVYWADHEEQFGNRPFQKKILLEGMMNQQALDLIPLAKSWLSPTLLQNVKGCTGAYDQEERAYVFEKEADKLSMTLLANEEKPVRNLCLIIKHWDSKHEAVVSIDGEPSVTKQGIVRDTDGSLKLVIWIEKSTIEGFDLTIQTK